MVIVKAFRKGFRNLNAGAEFTQGAGLEFWRERIYNSMVSAMLVWGLLALIPSVWLSFTSGLFGLGLFDLFAYIFLIGLYLLRGRAPYSLRALLLILLGLSVGVVVFFATGDEGAGLFWMFAVPPFASLLLGLPWGLFFSALNIAMFVGLGYLVFTGSSAIPGIQNLSFGGWAVYGINFLAANAIVTVPLGALLEGLFRSSERQQVLEQDYQLLFNNNPLPMWVYDAKTLCFLAVNTAATEHYGYSHKEFLARTIKDIRPKDEIPALEQNLEAIGRKTRQHSGPWKHLKKDGTLIDVEIHSHSLRFGEKDARLVLANDITDRLQAESKMFESEERFEKAFRASPLGLSISRLEDNTYIDVNQTWSNIFGYSREQVLDRSAAELGIEAKINQDLTQELREKGAVHNIEATYQSRFLGPRTILMSIEVIGLGEELCALSTFIDITEIRQGEARLRLSDQILQRVKSIVLVMDKEGQIIYASPASEEVLGYKSEELLGDGWWRVSRSEPTLSEDEKNSLRRIAAGEEPISPEPYDRPIKARNGETRWIEWLDSIGPNQTMIGVGRDVTENKRAEEALRHRLEELEAIRDVTAGLRSAITLEQMLPMFMDSTLKVMKVDAGAIWLYDKEKDEVRVAISRGYSGEDGGEVEIPPEKPGTGLAGAIFSGGWTHVSSEYKSDPRISEEIRGNIPAGVGGVSVPIRTEQGPIGVLSVNTRLPRVAEDIEVNLLTTLAEIIGSAIRRGMLRQRTEHQLLQLNALSEIDRLILSSFDLKRNLRFLLERLVEVLGGDAGNIMLYDPVLQTLNSYQLHGFRTLTEDRSTLQIGEGYAGRAAAERRMIHIDNLDKRKDNPLLLEAVGAEGFTDYYAEPMISKGQLMGVLEVFHRGPLPADEDWLRLLKTLADRAAIAIDTVKSFEDLERTNADLVLSYDATIEGWASALDLRDKETEGHSRRVTELGLELARRMGFGGQDLVNFRRGALLHDIGKMGLPDAILFKPDKLSEDEWKIMKQHTTFAQEMLMDISYLRYALDIPYAHHERWDGSGYPQALKGEEIPIAARIFAVADVYDALTSDRPYRRAWTKEQAVTYIRDQAGKQFDSKVVEVFLKYHLATKTLQADGGAML